MIPLLINKENDFINIKYESESDYFKIYDNIYDREMNYLILYSPIKTISLSHQCDIRKETHRKYWNSLDYSLVELLNHLKAITKIYKDYLIVDYRFHGVFLTNNDEKIHFCQFGSYDEEDEDGLFNCHLLGKSFKNFVEILTNQKRLGEIHIKLIDVILIKNKPTQTRKRTHIPRGLRHEVFKRDNYTCCECGAKKSDGVTLHVDHKIPVSKGGTDELDNLQTLCSDCNLNKSNIIQ